MKKKIVVTLFTLIFAVFGLFGVTACKYTPDGSDPDGSGTENVDDNKESGTNHGTDDEGKEKPAVKPTAYTFLDGVLYGDEDFVERIKTAAKREVETVDDIPSDAIYVSPTGTSSGKGTEDSPLNLTYALSKATAQIKNGGNGVILMREGTYGHTYFYALAQGNKDSYVTVTNYPGETVKISEPSGDSTGLFHLGTSNYVIIEGLIFCDNVATKTVKGLTADGNGVNHIIIKNNEFYNIRCSAKTGESNNGPVINFRGYKAGSPHSNFLVYNNNIHDCTTGWSEALTFVGNCEYINVIGNTIRDTGNIGIDVAGNWNDVKNSDEDQARYVVVRGNDVSVCNSPYARSYALYCDGARDVIFENNVAYDSQGGLEVGSENIKPEHPVKNIIIRNNLIYNNSQKGITVGGYNVTKAGVVHNVEIYNNTVVNNGTEGEISVTMVEGVKIYNNVLYSSDKNQYLLYRSAAIPESYVKDVVYNNNLYYSGSNRADAKFNFGGTEIGFDALKTTYDANAMYFDPQFKDLAKLDFMLGANSAAIDKGVAVDGVLYDLLRHTRVNGTIDLGCYEYFS